METTLDQIKYELGILRAKRAYPVIDKAIREGFIPVSQRDAAAMLAVENPDQFEKLIAVGKPAPGTLTSSETTICANLGIADHGKFLASKAARAK